MLRNFCFSVVLSILALVVNAHERASGSKLLKLEIFVVNNNGAFFAEVIVLSGSATLSGVTVPAIITGDSVVIESHIGTLPSSGIVEPTMLSNSDIAALRLSAVEDIVITQVKT